MRETRALLLASIPAVFVLLWSTGWISARAAAPYADPLTFLAIRFGLAALIMGGICAVAAVTWPDTWSDRWHILVSGVLLHAGYLGPLWWAIAEGVPAGVSGVLAGVQPLLTAALAPALLSERISPRQWLGIGLGFVGIVLVLSPKLFGLDVATLTTLRFALFVNVLGMISVTFGTFYQKRFVSGGDLRAVAALQYVGAAIPMLIVAVLVEPMRFEANLQSVGAMVWSLLSNSILAVLLMLWLIREGAVSRIATLNYLVPPVVVVLAWVLFGETVSLVQMCGIAVVCVGVALAMRR